MFEKPIPAFESNQVAIACSSSNEYAPYLSVFLQSVLEYASSEKKYDIFVFERDISDENKRKILSFVQFENVSLRFLNPSEVFKGKKLHVSLSYFKEECYYRIASPVLLSLFDKIIFTDIDLVFNDDILKLADVDLNGKTIACCKEPLLQELYEDNIKIAGIKMKKYIDTVLKMKPSEYFNTGVMLLDVQKYNQQGAFDRLMDLIAKNQFVYQEQDALNVCFKGDFFELSPLWNGELSSAILNMRKEYYRSYKDNVGSSYVFHWLGRRKPWFFPEAYGEIWWLYAKKTPFYEEILSRMLLFQTNEIFKENFMFLDVFLHPFRFQLKKFKYAIFKKIFWGAKKRKYKEKYRKIKELIKKSHEKYEKNFKK